MITDEHPFFSHELEGLPVYVAGEWDGILLSTSLHRHPEKSGVEVTHVYDQRLPLIEGAPTINDLPGALWVRSHCVR